MPKVTQLVVGEGGVASTFLWPLNLCPPRSTVQSVEEACAGEWRILFNSLAHHLLALEPWARKPPLLRAMLVTSGRI